MAKTLILVLLSLPLFQAQQTSATAPPASSYKLYEAAWDGDKTALQQLKTRAEQGQIDAQSLLGRLYFFSFKVPKDCVEALRWSRKGAEQGNSMAQFSLGMLYDGSSCIPKDQVEALRWYRKSAEQGIPEAQSITGDMYAQGEGAPRDYSEAARWYRKAADAGNAAAQYSLGAMYEKGQGVPKDAGQVVQWYRKAAEQGNAGAQFNLGLMYRNGDGIPRDLAQAVDLFRKAAEQGNTDAQVNLAYHYAVGEGVPKDAVQSNAWYRKSGGIEPNPWVAALQKNPDACFVLPCSTSGSAPFPRGLVIPGNVPLMDAKRPIPMLREGGVYKVPVLINNAITLSFVVDSGAADVSIPADVVTTLMRTGTITQSDFIGARTYTLADGSRTSSRTFRIRSLKVGDIVLHDVMGSVANREGDLLLGQSFLGRFKSWSIDNTKHALVLE